MSSGQSFLGGAAWLAAAGIISKILGAAFRIPLARLIGSEGMGLFGMAYPLYTMILALSTAGIPVAISKLVAEKMALKEPAEAAAVFKVANRFLFLSGAFFAALTAVLARVFVDQGVIRDPRAIWPLLAISPAVLLVAINAVSRGYFQGLQDMRPTAVSQVVEQFLRATTALALGYFLLPYGLEFATAGATFGAVTGSMGAGAVLWLYRRRSPSQALIASPWPRKWLPILKQILALAIPVTMSSLMMPIMQNMDVLLVPVRLEAAGYTVKEATALFGQLSEMAATLINLPIILTGALGVSLVPAISAARNPLQLQKYIGAAFRFTILLQLPAAAGLYLLAEPIMSLLYASPEAGPALAASAAICLFLGLHQTTAGILQGLGRTGLPVRSLAVGAIVKVVLTYILTARPALGIKGAAWASVVTYAVVAILNSYFIQRLVGLPWDTTTFFLKPLLATAGMSAVVSVGYRFLRPAIGSHPAAVVTIALGIVAYGLLLVIVRALGPADLALLGTFKGKVLGRLHPRWKRR